MSELPPDIDSILASIRSRMADDGMPPAAAVADAPAPAAAAPVIDPGPVLMTGGEMTLDSLMRSLLEPILQHWLDTNLPEIVEKVAQAEIRRLTGRD
jgi:uncharacterized protein